MTTEPPERTPRARTDNPAEQPMSLDRLDALSGEWETEATSEAGYFGPGSPATTGRGGRTTFEWPARRSFLIQRLGMGHRAATGGMAMIGVGPEPETFTRHHLDSRGVAREYRMSLDGGVWTLWREAPPFAYYEPARWAMDDTRRYAVRMGLIDMRPRRDIASTGYALASPGSEYLVLEPDGDGRNLSRPAPPLCT